MRRSSASRSSPGLEPGRRRAIGRALRSARVGAAVAGREAAAHVGQGAGANRVLAPIEVVHRRIGAVSSSASFARRPGRAAERPEVDAAVAGLRRVHDLQPWPRLARIEGEVGAATPGLPRRLYFGSCRRISRASTTSASSSPPQRMPSTERTSSSRFTILLPLVAVEVRLHPSAQVVGLPDVEHPPVASLEQVDTRGVRGAGRRGGSCRSWRSAPARPRRGRPSSGCRAGRRDRAARAAPRRMPPRRRAPGGRLRRAEVVRERRQPHVGHVGPDHATREPSRAQRRAGERRIVEHVAVGVQETEVEPALCATKTDPRKNSRNAGSTCSIGGSPETRRSSIPVRWAMYGGSAGDPRAPGTTRSVPRRGTSRRRSR